MKNWDISASDTQAARAKLSKRLYANLERAGAASGCLCDSDTPAVQSVFSVQGADSVFTYYLAETVQEICAVLDDCGDATTGKVE